MLGFTTTSHCLPAQTMADAHPVATLSSPTSTLPASVHVSSSQPTYAPEDEALLARQNNEDDPPPFNPPVTAAPTQEEALASLGWKQTTYYECRTRGGQEHCGWHIPVYKAEAAGRGAELGVVVGVAALAVGVLL
ncbi:hypothetical protein FALBO_4817 [Fusarium albosuccineum]|uniref:Uncharacterized protein n=1 Tax=Fusarium albosuccineum TaxID=1237068 RepID=A0A8H4LH83_9HYPO|nr:hypothetical protein FALBO_4817 [Fusarium albosuccineum]